ncbi:MAG: hypothetical protein U0T61_02015 [Buchnera aphidicola (Melaphis rhois)]
MIKQYLLIKPNYPEMFLFYRMGIFMHYFMTMLNVFLIF